MPPVAVTADNELVPIPAAGMSGNRTAEFLLSCLPHNQAVRFGTCRIPQRLTGQIAAVTYQVCQEKDPVLAPDFGVCRLGKKTSSCDSSARVKVVDPLPASGTQQAVPSGRSNGAPARQSPDQSPPCRKEG